VDESQISDLARTSAVMRRAVALAEWVADSGPRAVTGREVLRKPDVPAAAAAIGIQLPKPFAPRLMCANCIARGFSRRQPG
jgi:hypothetical protein